VEVNVNNVLERYFNRLQSTGHSNEALKVFIMSCMCDWKDEIMECFECADKELNKLCECLNGSSCIFKYDQNC